jgi:hypothetical protein
MHPSTSLQCIANPGNDGDEEVPLWLCPCRECTRLDWEIRRDSNDLGVVTLGEFRREMFPEHYGPAK